MAMDNSQNSFRRGVMTLVILGLLKKEDMYGYQLVQETKRKSGGKIITQEGSLYPVLYKLVEQDLISDRRVQVGKRKTRIYYHLEPAGEICFKQLLHEYEEITTGVLNIVKESNIADNKYPCPEVSFGSPSSVAVEDEAEEKNTSSSERFCPGVCF